MRLMFPPQPPPPEPRVLQRLAGVHRAGRGWCGGGQISPPTPKTLSFGLVPGGMGLARWASFPPQPPLPNPGYHSVQLEYIGPGGGGAVNSPIRFA